MTDSAVAEPPATDTTASELDLDQGTKEGQAYKIAEFAYGNSKVTLLGKMVTTTSGEQFERRFFSTEHFYKDSDGKWARNNYFEKEQLDELIMAAQDARRALHDKTLKPSN